MRENRISDCLGTLRKRTGPQHHVLEAWFHRGNSPSVRFGRVHSINLVLACLAFLVTPYWGALWTATCLVLFTIDLKCSASGMAHIKIDGASHAESHVLCRSGHSCKKENQY